MHIEVVSGLKLNWIDCDKKNFLPIYYFFSTLWYLFYYHNYISGLFKIAFFSATFTIFIFHLIYFQYSRHKIWSRQSGRREIFFWRHGEGKMWVIILTNLIFLLQFAQSKNGAKEIGRKSKHTSWYCEGTLVSLCCSLAIYTHPSLNVLVVTCTSVLCHGCDVTSSSRFYYLCFLLYASNLHDPFYKVNMNVDFLGFYASQDLCVKAFDSLNVFHSKKGE